jgi:ribonuclease J
VARLCSSIGKEPNDRPALGSAPSGVFLMRVCIHRGAREIGGSCVEVVIDQFRLILDLGRPLEPERDDGTRLSLFRELAWPPAAARNGSVSGVVVSHGHVDHWGLVPLIDKEIPIICGEGTARTLHAASLFTPGYGVDFRPRWLLNDREPIQVGAFTLTPYLTDHSAFDAYMVLVEAGGRRLLYSGDLRAHGRKSKLFDRFVAAPPADVDAMILEGTHVRQPGPIPQAGMASELDVENRCAELFHETLGMVLACYSPLNVDRLVSLYKAARRSGRIFVMDLYAATVMRATRSKALPQAHWDGVRVFVPQSQRARVKRERKFALTVAVRDQRIYPEELRADPGQFVMTCRASMLPDLRAARCLDAAAGVWSLWPGYLQMPAGVEFEAQLMADGIDLHQIHASGHATVTDLQRLAVAVNPRALVPIHTQAQHRFAELFANVHEHDDGEWWDV